METLRVKIIFKDTAPVSRDLKRQEKYRAGRPEKMLNRAFRYKYIMGDGIWMG